MIRSFAHVLIGGLVLACTGAVSEPSPSVTAAPTVASVDPSPVSPASPSATPHLRGTTVSLPIDRDTHAFFADGPRLFAIWKKEGPAPYDSRILVADPAGATWRTLYRSDSFLRAAPSAASGRVALLEYRERPQGAGAFSETFVLLDLATGNKTDFASHSLSSATFRGGGGGPRRPVGSVALGAQHVAYTRLIEGPGGTITGELYVAPLDALGSVRKVATSSEWVSPLGISGKRLVYVLGSKLEDELRLLDLDSGMERTLARLALGPGDYATPLNGAVISAEWALWLEAARSSSSAKAVSLTTGEQRVMPADGNCTLPSASTRYVAWRCRSGGGPAVTATVLDPRTLAATNVVPATIGNELVASGDGLIWTGVVADGRRVTYFVPAQ